MTIFGPILVMMMPKMLIFSFLATAAQVQPKAFHAKMVAS